VASVSKLIEENGELKKEIENQIRERSLALKSELVARFKLFGDVNFLATEVDLQNADAVKTLAYALKSEVDNIFLVLGAQFGGKPSLTVVIADDLAKTRGWNAAAIVKELAKDIQGGG